MSHAREEAKFTANVPEGDRAEFVVQNALALDRAYKEQVERLRKRVRQLDAMVAALKQSNADLRADNARLREKP